MMISIRYHIVLLMGLIFLTACASGPRKQPLPLNIRQAERQLRLGTKLYEKGCYASAQHHFQGAHERFAAVDLLSGVANSLTGIANVYYHLDDFTSAVRVYDDAIEAFSLIGDLSGLVRATTNKSAALVAADRLSRAAAVLDQADRAAHDQDILLALRLKTRALLMLRRGNLPAARRLLDLALEAAPEDDLTLIADVHYTLGRLQLRRNQTDQAIDHLNKALSIDREAGAYDNIAKDLESLGASHAQAGRHAEAAGYFKRSLKICALLKQGVRLQQVMDQLHASAAKADIDLQAIVFWVRQWQDGNHASNLCR